MISFFKRFILMLQFLTTIPIPVCLDVNEEDFGKGLTFAPVVGLAIGALLAAAASLMTRFFPLPIASVLIIVLYIVLTGGIHLDGLGDTFDGLFSNRPKERILEIMRDSRVGTNAVLAIFAVLLMNYSAFSVLKHSLVFAVLLMPVSGRIGSLVGAGISKYAREGKGLGKAFIDVCGIKEMIIGLLLALIPFYLLLSLKGVLLFFISIISTVIFTKIFSGKIGGMTGDTLGAVCELNQTVFLLCFYILL